MLEDLFCSLQVTFNNNQRTLHLYKPLRKGRALTLYFACSGSLCLSVFVVCLLPKPLLLLGAGSAAEQPLWAPRPHAGLPSAAPSMALTRGDGSDCGAVQAEAAVGAGECCLQGSMLAAIDHQTLCIALSGGWVSS